jgi:hypothetical protein
MTSMEGSIKSTYSCHVLATHQNETNGDSVAGSSLEKTFDHLLDSQMAGVEKFSELNKDLLGTLPVVLLRKEAGCLGTEKNTD